MKGTIGFIGAGNMGEALMRGIIKANLLSPQNVYAADTRGPRLKELQENHGITTLSDNKELVLKAGIIVLAVKPQNMEEVLKEIAPAIKEEHLVISIAAGITASYIANHFEQKVPIVRVMPNTPALVQEGMSALARGEHATESDIERAELLFGSVGKTVVVDESLMDAVTGLSGSGPAYFFLFIEVLTDAGAKMGLSSSVAQLLATQTCLGAAKMILETGKEPAALKDMVTSKGGTTFSGLKAMEAGGLRKALLEGVEAATKRSKELGEEKKQ